MVIVKLGGCNGSGKSSVFQAILQGAHQRRPLLYSPKAPTISSRQRIAGYAILHPETEQFARTIILGKYETACGGMDTISDKEDRLALLDRYAKPGTLLLYEGLITGKTYGAMGALSESPKHRNRWLYAFMDTPFEVCVQRVLQRRQAKGNHAPFDAERTMRSTFRSVQATAVRAQAEGHAVLWLPHQMPPERIATTLLHAASALGRQHAI